MKIFWIMLFLPIYTYALDCSVDGISDSPQKLNCYIHNSMQLEPIELACREGNYKIIWGNKLYDVDQAYHEEVEVGSNPLVFQAGRFALTITSYKIYSRAYLTIDKRTHHGLCFNY